MAETEAEGKPKGRGITIEQRKKAQAKRLAEKLRANLLRRKSQARQRRSPDA